MSFHLRPSDRKASAMPVRRIAILLTVALSLTFCNKAYTEDTFLSLERAIEIAQERNESILIAYEDQKNANAFVREAYSNLLPNLQLQASYQRNITKPAFFLPPELADEDGETKVEIGSDFQAAAELRVDQVLYAFGRLGNALAAARLVTRIASLGVENARGELIFMVKQAYYRVLLARSVASIQRRSLHQAESHLAQIENKLSQGTVSRFDHLRAQVEVKNRQPALIAAENDLALAMQDLKQIVGIDAEPDPTLSDSLAYTPLELGVEQAVEEAFSRRPEILSLQLNLEKNKRRLSIQKAGRLPTLGLFGQLLFQGEADDDIFEPFDSKHRAVSSAVGIALTVPIFDGFRTKARIQQASADLNKAEHELSRGQKAVRLEVTKAVKDLNSLRRAYEAQRATVSLAEETYEIADTRFTSGLSTQLELTDAETALEMARVNFATTLHDYDVAVANLERALGRYARTDAGPQIENNNGEEE